MKKVKVVVCVLIVLLLCASLSACKSFQYYGAYRDLYTVAVNNIFGARGYMGDGEWVAEPTIFIIETDNFGRVLFFYSEYFSGEQNYGTAIVVMQKSDGDCVYYYQDVCYTPCFRVDIPYYIGYRNLFTEEDIAALKEVNDWNKEVNLDKCTKSQISTEKPSATLKIKSKEFNEAIYPYMQSVGYKGDDGICRYSVFCNADKYGRELYYVWGIVRDADGEGVSSNSQYQYLEFAVIFNPDRTCPFENIYQITDSSLTVEALKTLKETAGWNQPY